MWRRRNPTGKIFPATNGSHGCFSMWKNDWVKDSRKKSDAFQGSKNELSVTQCFDGFWHQIRLSNFRCLWMRAGDSWNLWTAVSSKWKALMQRWEETAKPPNLCCYPQTTGGLQGMLFWWLQNANDQSGKDELIIGILTCFTFNVVSCHQNWNFQQRHWILAVGGPCIGDHRCVRVVSSLFPVFFFTLVDLLTSRRFWLARESDGSNAFGKPFRLTTSTTAVWWTWRYG